MRRKVRILRHWKQRFRKDAEFIWRRPVIYAGEKCNPGDSIPDILAVNVAKLRRFWESGTIELAQFEDPNVLTGRVARSTPSEDMVRELARQQAKAQARIEAKAQARIEAKAQARIEAEVAATKAADDFAETEDEKFDPEAEDWLDGDKS